MAYRWTELTLTQTGPREPSEFKQVAWNKGIAQAYKLAGILTLVGGLSGLIPLFLQPNTPPMSTFFVIPIFIFFSLFSLQMARGAKAQRLRFLIEGELILGRVTEQGERFNPFSSTPSATITLELDLPDKPVITSTLWKRDGLAQTKPGQEVWILYLADTQSYWCPFETGLRLHPKIETT
jgi:hypothetical protein